jgi:hypothetical protein
MRANSSRLTLAVLLLMPVLATCTGPREPAVQESESLSAAAEDERLVSLLIDGVSAKSR